ncbi:ATP-binding protein [Pedobacter frigoris]|uniref:AAA family ATPase n=1 Tax=Pedobacter frigoris TaxID=2571272 RepID=UPI00292D4562|nr:ATP-binding protein [Pedobacter frigoris]
MLIKFTAENFLSFYEETEFNMLTGEVRRLPDHVYSLPKVDILKSAVIYGANGAGKSNLIIAIDALRTVVTEGCLDFLTSETCFRMKDTLSKPSKLEIEFIVDEVGYAYGLCFFENRITEEWLYVLNYGKKNDELVFERALVKGKESIKMSPKYSKNQKDRLLIQVYEEDLLEEDVPFLFMVKDKKFTEISNAFKWFNQGMQIVFPRMQYSGLVYSFINDKKFKAFTNHMIAQLSTGIQEIDILSIDFDQFFGEDNLSEKERVLKIIRSGEQERVGDSREAIALMEDGKPVVKKAVSYHNNDKGEKVRFELSEESDGTRRLIDFIPLLYMLDYYPVTIIIDEIDQSLHPALLKEFVSFVQNNKAKKGQLIITTHESNLLDLDLFRQDEIWFAEKNEMGASHFYPLSDYNVRPDLDIRKGYLSGRFGAIPFLASLKDLNWEEHVQEH